MATQRVSPLEGFSTSLASALDDYISQLRTQIADQARDVAREFQRESGAPIDSELRVTIRDLSRAADEVTGVRRIEPISKAMGFFQLFPPFTCVCAILCIAFATLGLWALQRGGTGIAGATSSFLDIAKIFAGAIVGSTASNVITAGRQRFARSK